jgi:hypothetical protein
VAKSAEAPHVDDGFQSALRSARLTCGVLLLSPPVFAAISALSIARGGVPHEEPIIVAMLAIVGLTVMCSPGLAREELVRKAIGRYLAAPGGVGGPEAVYRSFVGAAIAAYAIAGTGVLFGFAASVFTNTWTPLAVGSVASYAMWAALWPRRGVWRRWTWQAKLRRDEPARSADGTAG